MADLTKTSLIGVIADWPKSPMKLKIWFPYDWKKKATDTSLESIKLKAEKKIEVDTRVFMTVSCHTHRTHFSDEDLVSIRNEYYNKPTSKLLGEYLCSDFIKIGESKGFWLLHKSDHNGQFGYRLTYILYNWKYSCTIFFGAISNNEDLARSVYKEYDDLFHDLAIKTTFRWKRVGIVSKLKGLFNS